VAGWQAAWRVQVGHTDGARAKQAKRRAAPFMHLKVGIVIGHAGRKYYNHALKALEVRRLARREGRERRE
jgi:hypothetical protein